MLAYIKLTVESVFVPMQGDGCSFLIRENVQEFRQKKTPNGQLCNRHEGFFLAIWRLFSWFYVYPSIEEESV